MTSKISVPDDVKEQIKRIIVKNNLGLKSNVVYSVGSEIGDGILSKTVTVDIESPKEELNLFIKYGLKTNSQDLKQIYANEIHFYEVIMPVYLDFLAKKNIEDTFRNVPKCYGTFNGIVALENLRKKGYKLCNKALIANDEHITLIFKTYAKFHATSFAFKDQHVEEYRKIMMKVTDMYSYNASDEKLVRQHELLKIMINNFVKRLDPVKDKYILDRSGSIADDIIKFNNSLHKLQYENDILIQGDCWCDNMMFLYEVSFK